MEFMEKIYDLNKNGYFFQIEKKFDSVEYVNSAVRWMSKNWYQTIYYSIAYIILIFALKALMKERKPFDLRIPLAFWNTFLAVFSIVGAYKTVPRLVQKTMSNGLDYGVCDNSYVYGSTGFWSFLFCFSKVPELFDTLFIVLRKRPLIFLHYYHHATVLIYTWYSCHDVASTGNTFACMNYIVHSLMYSYYALKEFKVYVPKWCAKCITTLQLSQMVVGCFVNSYAWYLKLNGYQCATTYENIFVSFVMYFSYFLLFFHFFINAYLNKNKSQNKTVKFD